MPPSNWIKWTKGLTRKAEVVEMAKILKLDRRLVAAMLMELWEWADDNTEDGCVKGVDCLFIDDLLSQTGFYQALYNVNWVKKTRNGIKLKDYERHNGKSAKRRALDAERKARSRKSPHKERT